MIPRFKPKLGWRELLAALRFPKSDDDDVQRFERAFAHTMGQKHAVAFPYGRTGLVVLLEALGLKGREIICPAYTCVVVPHAIVTSGNEPVFVDSQESDFNMDLGLVPAAITPATGAIIATSIFGFPVDLDRLAVLRQQHPGIHIIQDCAHSFGAEWKGQPVHRAGEAALFGLNVSKLIHSVFGGMVTSDDADLADRLRHLRQQRLQPARLRKSLRRLLYLMAAYPTFWPPLYGVVSRLERSGWLNRFSKYYDDAVIDMPPDYLESLTPLEARVGVVQLGRYPEIIRQRRHEAAAWRECLAEEEGLRLPPDVAGATYSHFPCVVDDKAAWMDGWRRRGVQLGEVIQYAIPYMRAYESRRRCECPVARRLAETTINFPVGSGYAMRLRARGR